MFILDHQADEDILTKALAHNKLMTEVVDLNTQLNSALLDRKQTGEENRKVIFVFNLSDVHQQNHQNETWLV